MIFWFLMFHSLQGSGEIFHVLYELSRQGFLSTVSLTKPSEYLTSWESDASPSPERSKT